MRTQMRHLFLWIIACIDLSAGNCTVAAATDWNGFRGPDRLGTAEAKDLPVTWNSNANIVWKQALPGPGTSSPIVVGPRIYLTCYSGYAESIENPGEMAALTRHVVCLEHETGKIVWTKSFKAKMPESEYQPGNNSRHGYASSTLTSDGRRLYVFFGISGVFCLDLDGRVVWNTEVGSGTHGWGSATSPLLCGGLVIVNASVESKSLVALDQATGKEAWRKTGINSCWSSPVLVDAGGKQEVVLNTPHKIAGFDPKTGEELWHCEGVPDGYICPTAIVHEDVVYAIGGRKNTAIAVRAGGRRDVTGTHVLWTADKGSNVSSPVYLDGHLYWFHESRGMAYCLNAKTGEVVYESRLEPRPGLIYASVTAADGKLYAPSQEQGVYVVEAKPTFKQLAVNVLEEDSSRTNASIVVSRDRLILRTDKAIYCIGR
ncbi:MAG: PQQ-like beta-propeller repeat protein [Pirellulales bacterium]|nr:PQQ-like beta-propeller repeat protein [Pirellulales bacterium]